jgi:hypothetical protein
MTSLFKFIFFSIFLIVAIIIGGLATAHIEKHNLVEKAMESNFSLAESASLIGTTTTKNSQLDYFAVPSDKSPIMVEVTERGAPKEHQYIYPSQIFYADRHEIKILFRDSVFTIPNKIKLKKLKEELESRRQLGNFLEIQSYLINRSAIVGYKARKHSSGAGYALLLNGDSIPLSRGTYKEEIKVVEH